LASPSKARDRQFLHCLTPYHSTDPIWVEALNMQ
jgi:hypothetical protein